MSEAENKTIVRRYIEEVVNGGNLDLIDTFFAPQMREQVRWFMTAGGDQFPDAREEIQDIVAEGDMVMARWIFRATHRGEFLGIAPTGNKIEITGYSTYRLENGQIVWDTASFDWLEAVEQMGGSVRGPES